MRTCTLGRGLRGMHFTLMLRSEASMACARARSGAVYVACMLRSCSDVRQVWHAHVHARARCTWHAFHVHDRCETRVYSRERRLCNIGWIDITGGFMWAPSSRYDRLSRSLEGVSTWHLWSAWEVRDRVREADCRGGSGRAFRQLAASHVMA